MLIGLIVSLIVCVVFFGGAIYYYKLFKALLKETKEFMEVAFIALQDKKLTIVEKEALLKELSDIKPVLNKIKTKFVGDAIELSGIIKKEYEDIKTKIKS